MTAVMPAARPEAPARRISLLSWLRDKPRPVASLWVAIALALVSCLPLLVAGHYPQMVDYPAHLARYHVMLSRDASPFLQQYYGFEWRWMGNLGGDILIRPLAALFGLEPGARIMVTAIPVLIGLGIVAVDWTLHRRIGIGAMLAFAFIWSPSMQLGFINYGLSLAAALFAFAAWVKLDGWRWRAPLFVPIGALVWLAHVSGWGVLGIMVFGYEWSKAKSWRAFVAPWPLMFPMAVLALGATSGTGDQIASYGPAFRIYKLAIWRQAMRDTWEWLDYGSLAFVGLVLTGSLLAFRWDGRLGWAAIAMLVLSIIMPRHIFGGDYVDARLISTGLLVGCLALRWHGPRWLVYAAALLFLGRLALTTQDSARDSQRSAQIASLVEHLPQGARVASLVVTERGRWGYNGLEHIGAYAVVRRDALNNSNFALPLVHMLTIRDAGPQFRDPYHRILHLPGTPVKVAGYAPLSDADWFWYIGDEEPVDVPRSMTIVARVPGAFLAKLAKPPRHS